MVYPVGVQINRQSVILTQRELEIIRHLLAGESNVYMAQILGISVWTVKRHFTNIFDKTGMCSRMEVAMWAVGKGMKPYFLQNAGYLEKSCDTEDF